MKNLKFNERINNIMSRSKKFVIGGISLLGVSTCILSFSGCEEAKTNVKDTVASLTEAARQQIIEECAKEGEIMGYSKDEINLNIYRKFEEKHLLTEDDRISYEKLLKKLSENNSITYYYTK